MQQEPAYHELPLPARNAGAELNPSPFCPNCPLDPEVQEQTGVDLSHELRTSLAIITLLSGNLDILYDELDNRKRRKMIRDVRRHTQKLNDIIVEVLEICNDQGPLTM